MFVDALYSHERVSPCIPTIASLPSSVCGFPSLLRFLRFLQTFHFQVPNSVLQSNNPKPSLRVEIFDSSELSKSVGEVNIPLARPIAYFDQPWTTALGVVRKGKIQGFLSFSIKCLQPSFAPAKGTSEYDAYVSRLVPPPPAKSAPAPAPSRAYSAPAPGYGAPGHGAPAYGAHPPASFGHAQPGYGHPPPAYGQPPPAYGHAYPPQGHPPQPGYPPQAYPPQPGYPPQAYGQPGYPYPPQYGSGHHPPQQVVVVQDGHGSYGHGSYGRRGMGGGMGGAGMLGVGLVGGMAGGLLLGEALDDDNDFGGGDFGGGDF